MTDFALSIPKKRVSAWVAETDPKATRVWLATLPLADSAEAARELYQAVYTLNREELAAGDRMELMGLYCEPVAAVTSALQAYFSRLALPLSAQKRQLAEFLRQLQMEMACGYKCVLHDLQKVRLPWGRKGLQAGAIERALYYLGEVLLRSYQVYMPAPAGIWREIHELYRYAEGQQRLEEPLAVMPAAGGPARITVAKRYLQIALLGLASPYQLPQNECHRVSGFLEHWADQARISTELAVANPAGQFLIDLAADSPPVPYPRERTPVPGRPWRVLNALGLARTVHSFMGRLRKGEPSRALGLGVDCPDELCMDLLRRLVRSWGLAAQRRHSRSRKHGPVSLCAGIEALHFFAGGQKPFAARGPESVIPRDDAATRALPAADEAYIDLDALQEAPEPVPPPATPGPNLGEMLQVDRWQVADESSHGLSLIRSGEAVTRIRVGDLLGIQDSGDTTRWRPGVVRWLKSPDTQRLEMGIELLGAGVTPVAVKSAAGAADLAGGFLPALLIAPGEGFHRPATLAVGRGAYKPGLAFYLTEGEAAPRQIRPLEVVERTGSFEQFAFAPVAPD